MSLIWRAMSVSTYLLLGELEKLHELIIDINEEIKN